MPLTDVTRDELRALMARYPVARAALLPMLHLVQSHEGFVSEDGIALCAELLGLTKAEVGAVATFYTMFKREPVGDYLLSVCTNPTCKIAGGQEIYEGWVERCGGAHTDPDGAGVMVEHAECLGICDAAPVVQINYEMYQPSDVSEGIGFFDKAKAGDPPPSNRSGETPATFREVERELSGIDDAFASHLVEAARRQATSAVPPAYRTGETDIPVTHPGGDPAGHGGQAFAASAGLDGHAPDAAAADATAASLAERPSKDEVATSDQVAAAEDVREEGGAETAELADHISGVTPSTRQADAAAGAGATTDEESSAFGADAAPADHGDHPDPVDDDADDAGIVDRTEDGDDQEGQQ